MFRVTVHFISVHPVTGTETRTFETVYDFTARDGVLELHLDEDEKLIVCVSLASVLDLEVEQIQVVDSEN